MSRRQIGQESFGFSECNRLHSCLDNLARLIDWAMARSSPAMRSSVGRRSGLSNGIISRLASPCRMASSRASMYACVMNCSMRPFFRRYIRRTWPWLFGVRSSTTLARTPNLAGGRQPSWPRRSRDGGRRCATPPAPRRPPPPHPPSGANPTARTNFRVNKSWGQGHNARTHADLECTQVETPLSGQARLRASQRTHGAGCANDRDRAGESEDCYREPRIRHAPLRLAIRKIRRSVSRRRREGQHTSQFSRNDRHQTAVKRVISRYHAE